MNKIITTAAMLLLGAVNSFSAATTNAPQMSTNLFDKDAYSYMVRSGMHSDIMAREATERLVRQLKSAGLWSSIYAFYPLWGATTNAHSVNLMSTNFSIIWNGDVTTMTFSTNGVTGNGTNGYGDTGFSWQTNAVSTNSLGLYVYYSTNNFYGNRALAGAVGSVHTNEITIREQGATRIINGRYNRVGENINVALAAAALLNGGGFFTSVNLGTNVSVTSAIATNYTGTSTNVSTGKTAIAHIPNVDATLYLLAFNSNNAPVLVTTGTVRTLAITRPLTVSQRTNFIYIVEQWNRRLNRSYVISP